MRTSFVTTVLLLGLCCSAVAGGADTADLIAACDRAAASSEDKSVPPGISGVAVERVDAGIAIAACEAAAKAAPDNARVLFELGRAYDAGKNYDAARVRYIEAVKAGSALAANNLGSHYAQGRGSLARDDHEAARLYRIAADQGVATAQTNLGTFYESGRGGLPKSDVEAVRLYKLAAEQANPAAINALGAFYQKGRGGLRQDDVEAARLYRLAADQGHTIARTNLGYFYESGRGGLAKDDIEAARLYKLAADQGYSVAQMFLGHFYETGRGGLAKEEREAARLYGLAAGQGNAFAQRKLGDFHRDGRGDLAKNDIEAARFYKLAAEQGDASAQKSLGYFHELGRGGLPKDDVQAARYYKLAADQNNAAAQCNLGVFYGKGRGGIARDEREALRLYKLAAGQDAACGHYNVGLYQESGRGGLAKDDAAAAREYKLALDGGQADAQTALDRVLKRLPKGLNAAVAPTPAVAGPNREPAGPASRRIALVIGNSAYNSAPVLPNPVRDAATVADALRKVGFQSVNLVKDAGREKMVEVLRNFTSEADNADWALIYYAGHGIELGGMNYLIPIDARLVTDRDVPLEAIALDQVMSATEGARKLRLVLLDACRDNPFLNQIKRSVASRSMGRGLAQVEPDAGMLVVYAAKHGQVALDGDGANSPFVAALTRRIATPQIEIRKLFDLVRDDVMAATGRQQQPFSYGSVPGSEDFYFVTRQTSQR